MQKHTVSLKTLSSTANPIQRFAVNAFASVVAKHERLGLSTADAIAKVAKENPASYRDWRVAQGFTARF